MPNLVTYSRDLIKDIFNRRSRLYFGVMELRYTVAQGAIVWTAEALPAVVDSWLDVPSATWEPWTGGILLSVRPAEGSAAAALELQSLDGALLRDHEGKAWSADEATSLTDKMLRFADPEETGMAFRIVARAVDVSGTLHVGLAYFDHTHYDGASGSVPPSPIIDFRPPIKDGPTKPDGKPTPPKPNLCVPWKVPMLPGFPGTPETAALHIQLQRMRNQMRHLQTPRLGPVTRAVNLHVVAPQVATHADR